MRHLFPPRDLIILAVLTFFLFTLQARAQEYEVEGIIQEHIIQLGQSDWTTSATFKVYVRDCSWLIETMETNSSGGSKQRRIGSMNGTEIFEITSYPKATPARSGTNSAAINHPVIRGADGGLILSNTVPVGSMNDSIIPHLWVMFASQCFFKAQNPTNRLMPVYDVDYALVDRVDLRLETDWELMKGKISLPLKVVYYNDGGFYTMDTNKVLKFQSYGPPYKSGFTDAIYAVTALTNFNGVTFPAGFTFGEYRPGGGPTRYQLQARKTAEAVVTAFRPVCSRKDLLPAIQNETIVHDERLAHAVPKVASFLYNLPTGGNWLQMPEAKQRMQVMQANTQQRNIPTASRGVLITLLLLTLVVMACFLLKSKTTTTALGYGAVPFLLFILLFAESLWERVPGSVFFGSITSQVTAVFRNSGTQWMIVSSLACGFFALLILECRAGYPASVTAGVSRLPSPEIAGRSRRIYARCRSWFANPNFWLVALVLLALARYVLAYEPATNPAFRSPKIPVLVAGIFFGKAISLWVRWRDKHVERRTAWLVSLLICCFACAAVWQQQAPMRFSYHGIPRWTGPWGNPNLFGLLMGTGVVLALGQMLQARRRMAEAGTWKKMIWMILCILVVILCGYGLFKSYSRGAWIGTSIGIVYLAWHDVQSRWFCWIKTNRLSISIILASCLLLGFWQFRYSEWRPAQRVVSVGNINDFSWRNRVAAWEGAIHMMADRPLAGFGWQEAEQAYAKQYLPPQLSESAAIQMNDYFMLGISAGVLALLCFLAYLWLLLTRKPDVMIQKPESATLDFALPAAPEWSKGGWILDWPIIACRAGVIVLLIGFWFDGGFFRLAVGPVFWILMGLSCLESPRGDEVTEPASENGKQKAENGNQPETPCVVYPSKKVVWLRRLAWGLAIIALLQTTVYWGTPFLPVGNGTLAVARKCLIPPGEIGDFDILSADPIWQGKKLKTLLEHADLATYNRQIVNWKLDDSIYREYVLPPAIQPERDGQYHWRRALWEYFYPRIRKQAGLASAAQTIRQQLQKRQKMVGKGPPTIEEMWQQQTADATGLEALCVAAWRSVGIPARLNADARAEFFSDGKWQ